MIKVEHINKVFKDQGNDVVALKDINLTLPSKGMVFILGKSGSGKSTLLNLIANFDKPTSGKIYFNDIDVTNFRERKRDKYLYRNVGFIFQAYNLFETLTVKENIALGLKTSYKKLDDQIDNILEEVHLKGCKNKLVKNLSGGQKQRVAIARALIKDPELILGDEPCGNLDNVNSQIVLDILKKRSETSLVVIVSLNIADAYKYASRVITLNQGEVLSDRVFNEESIEKSKDYVLINDLSLLRGTECDEISKKIKNRKIKGFYPRKEFFVNYSGDTNNDEPLKKNKPKRKGFLHSFKANLKLIHTKKYKYLAFSVITALSLGIFTACLALTDFNPNDYFIRNAKDMNLNPIKYIKGYKNETGETSYADLYEITNDDLKYIKEELDSGFYPRYRVPFELGDSSSLLMMGRQVGYQAIKNFYATTTTGLVLTNENHLKNIFMVDDVEYLAKLENPKNNGIYITDYLADSINFHDGTHRTYDEIINLYKNEFGSRSLKVTNPINGIIKTNYQSKCKLLKDGLQQGLSLSELTSKKEYVEILTYMLDALCTVYSYNENFIKDDMMAPQIYQNNISISEKDSEQVIKDFGSKKVTYSTLLPKKTLMIPYKMIAPNFPNFTAKQIEETLNLKNYYFTSKRTNSEFEEVDKISFDVNIWITENHLDKLDSKLSHLQKQLLTFSTDIYQVLKQKYAICFGLDFDNETIFSFNEELNSRCLLCDNYLTKYSTSVGSYIIRFKDIFRIFYFFCFVLSVVILVYYAISSIKDNAYNIGVLKSLGYRGNELGLFYLVSFILYSLITTAFFSLTYFLLSKLVNEVMVSLVNRGFKMQAVVGMPDVIAFDYRLFIGVTILLFSINLIFAFVYLFKLRKNRIAKVIQNKE